LDNDFLKVRQKNVGIPKLKLYGDRILVYREKHIPSELLQIPNDFLPYAHYAEVVDMGEDVTLDIKIGDIVLVPPLSGVQLWHRKGWKVSNFFLYRETEIMGKVQKGEYNPEDYEKEK